MLSSNAHALSELTPQEHSVQVVTSEVIDHNLQCELDLTFEYSHVGRALALPTSVVDWLRADDHNGTIVRQMASRLSTVGACTDIEGQR